MNIRNLSACFVFLSGLLPLSAPAAGGPVPVRPAESGPRTIEGWGVVINPSNDCGVTGGEDGRLTIAIPAGVEKAHNLCVELGNMAAPRVQQTVTGDFDLQVKVEGTFAPSPEVLAGSRVPYLGAGLHVMADDDNYVRMERASMIYGAPEPRQYINFEIRVDGQLERFGSSEKFPLDPDKPVWQRLERRADTLRGGVSQDGKRWEWGEPKVLTAAAWSEGSAKAGVHLISSCVQQFFAVFRDLKCTPATDGGPAKEPPAVEPEPPAKPPE